MNQNKIYDYIICGAGASGLALVSHFINDSYFEKNKILIIEKSNKNINDRTWSFWEKNNGPHDDIVLKKWDKASFFAENFSLNFSLSPYQFKTIRGLDFYNKILGEINESDFVELVNDEIIGINKSKDIVEIRTKNNCFLGRKVFSSIQKPFDQKRKYPLLKQHFVGWFIKTENPVFDPEKLVFMDFDINQKNNTRFIYLLPFTKNEALVEYTLFSKDLLEMSEYEKGIENYLKKINAGKIQIIEKEKGSIPMTSYPFWKDNTPNFIHIGTSGGWTKPSTGFTFFKILQKVPALIEHLKLSGDLQKFEKKNKYMLYDSLLIDVLYSKNEIGSDIFKGMFKNNKPSVILRFLEEKTSFHEELKLMKTFPKRIFIKALIKKLFRF
tara:strand:+ start:575 stop:1723 length:1149 start_codon:yes stop_codon:yes gene_type:complete